MTQGRINFIINDKQLIKKLGHDENKLLNFKNQSINFKQMVGGSYFGEIDFI